MHVYAMEYKKRRSLLKLRLVEKMVFVRSSLVYLKGFIAFG